MTVPTRQRTHLLAGPSLSGGSCGSISGDRGRVGRAGHRRGDRAVAARREDRGRGCHRLQESGVRRRTPSSGPRGRRPIPSLRAPVRTNTSWGRGAHVAPGRNRLRQNERRGGGGPRHVPDRQTPASGSARAIPENSIMLRSRFPFRPRRHPGPARATPPGPCGLAVPPRSSRSGGRAGQGGDYATSRTARTIYRGPRSSARARSHSAALVSSRSASAAPSLGGHLE
jgi:hypothetical protein